ncbi:tumor necrosis factor ligand superfamily member 15 [Discoglossus pictus]
MITVYLMVCSILLSRENTAQSTQNIALGYKAPGVKLHKMETPRAHLTGTQQDYSTLQNEALHWEDRLGNAFTKYGMNYSKPFLQIPKTGFYYIYSQVSFHSAESMCNHNINYVTQKITKINANYPAPEDLLSGMTKLCESNEYRPIYLGALLHLKEGDKLMVKVSDIKLVDVTMEQKTFFGAFLV